MFATPQSGSLIRLGPTQNAERISRWVWAGAKTCAASHSVRASGSGKLTSVKPNRRRRQARLAGANAHVKTLGGALAALLSLAHCDSQTGDPSPNDPTPTRAAAQVDEAQGRVETKKTAKPPAYSVPERSPAELHRELTGACEQARRSDQLVLLEFSAAWCKDCRRLSLMKSEPALAEELRRFREVVVNVGDFDRHAELLGRFGVRAIARWEVLEPGDCQRPAWTWKRRGHRTLEPETGKEKVAPADLEQWLRRLRAS